MILEMLINKPLELVCHGPLDLQIQLHQTSLLVT